MGIIGIGVDIQEIKKIKELFLGEDERSLHRIFTDKEIKEFKDKVNPEIHIAGKFAAKEAIFKSLSLSRSDGLLINDIEIIGPSGIQPICNFHGVVSEIIERRNCSNIMLSISHTEENAIAFAIYYS